MRWLCSPEDRAGCILFLAFDTNVYLFHVSMLNYGSFHGIVTCIAFWAYFLCNLPNATIIAVFDAGIFCL